MSGCQSTEIAHLWLCVAHPWVVQSAEKLGPICKDTDNVHFAPHVLVGYLGEGGDVNSELPIVVVAHDDACAAGGSEVRAVSRVGGVRRGDEGVRRKEKA